jgi:hypothetical protein
VASACSNACDYEGETAADIYECLESGTSVVVQACADAGIGTVPTSESTCCPAADENTCVASAADLTAPPPCPEDYASNPDLSTEEKARCGWKDFKEKSEDNAALVAVIVVVVVVAVLFLAYKCCCRESEDTDSRSRDVEKGAAAEAQENEQERRKKLKDRLAEIRGTVEDP